MADNLARLTASVIERRRHEAELRARLAEARAAWEADWADLLEALQATTAERATAEEALRAAVVAEYRATGAKKPAPGLGIRVVTRLEYEPGAALAWAKEHDVALVLDKAVFERLVKVAPLPFVTVHREPQATLAADLEPAEGASDAAE